MPEGAEQQEREAHHAHGDGERAGDVPAGGGRATLHLARTRGERPLGRPFSAGGDDAWRWGVAGPPGNAGSSSRALCQYASGALTVFGAWVTAGCGALCAARQNSGDGCFQGRLPSSVRVSCTITAMAPMTARVRYDGCEISVRMAASGPCMLPLWRMKPWRWDEGNPADAAQARSSLVREEGCRRLKHATDAERNAGADDVAVRSASLAFARHKMRRIGRRVCRKWRLDIHP
jgi:hypothetical protein